MNPTQTRDLLIKISAYKPAQQLNLLTAPAWQEALAGYSWDDCNQALLELVREREWIGVDDIAQRVKHYRSERVEAGWADLVPPADAREPGSRAYLDWSRTSRRRLGDGETAEQINGPQPQLHYRDLKAIA